MIRVMLDDLSGHVTSQETMNYQSEGLIQGVKSKIYQPLMKRVTCGTFASKLKPTLILTSY